MKSLSRVRLLEFLFRSGSDGISKLLNQTWSCLRYAQQSQSCDLRGSEESSVYCKASQGEWAVQAQKTQVRSGSQGEVCKDSVRSRVAGRPSSWSTVLWRLMVRLPADASGTSVPSLVPASPNSSVLVAACSSRLPGWGFSICRMTPGRGLECHLPPLRRNWRPLTLFYG